MILENAQDPAISPDGQWLAVAQPDATRRISASRW